MSSVSVYLTSDSGKELAGKVVFIKNDNPNSSLLGSRIGEQRVPIAGIELNAQYLAAADSITVGADGYYEFTTPISGLRSVNEFILVPKPSPVKYIIIGAIAFFALTQLKK